MSPATRSLFDSLKQSTVELLSAQDSQRYAIQVDHCIFSSRCGKHYCPQCAWVNALDRSVHAKNSVLRAAADFEAATSSELHLFDFTVKEPYVQVGRLREAGDRMTSKLAKMISKRTRTILGSASFFESLPALVRGESCEEDHPHAHCLIGTHDPDSLSLRAFRNLEHFEPVKLKSVPSWIAYGNKARPDQFAAHWNALLEQPATFVQRIEQMRNFQPARYSGLFNAPCAA
jgi:hypothetical protein